MAAQPLVSFVIPVKNDARRLDRCLASIEAAAASTPVQLVVVDNGSSDDSRDVARTHGAVVLECPGARVGQLRNTGADAASADIVAFVDADHEIGEGWVRAVLNCFSDRSLAAAGALYRAPVGGTWVQRQYDALRGRTEGCGDAEWMGAGNLAVRTETFKSLHGFDPSLEACEDVDFCYRLRQSGHRLVGDERLLSIHHGDPPTLRRLFVSEMWRGRDNLRVSLRGPLTVRSLPSVALPVLNLACLALTLLGSAAWPILGAAAGGAPAAVLAAMPLLRVSRMARHIPLRPLALIQAYAVTLTYEVARALALVVPAPHHRRMGTTAAAQRG